MQSVQQHRYFYLLIGSTEKRLTAFKTLSSHLRSPIITSTHSLPFYDNKLNEADPLTYYPFKKLPLMLGQTNEAILFDVENGLCTNGLAIASGTVKGGGLFAIGMSDFSEWLNSPDQELAKYLPWPLTIESATSHFKHYFLQQLMTFHRSTESNSLDVVADTEHEPIVSVIHLTSNTLLPPLPQIPRSPDANIHLTDQQQHTLDATKEHLIKHKRAVTVITAHRGRGKSTLLGIMAAELISQEWKVAVTAPRKDAIKTLNLHCDQYNHREESLPFYPMDQLILSPLELDCLIVDEAAAFPIPVLENLLNTYSRVVFSSTDHGYEIGGRGFGIRFLNSIKHANTPLLECTLDIPIRWKSNDPLEKWIDELLFLYQKNHSASEITYPKSQSISVKGSKWLDNSELLNSGFRLLVSAHYQTSPNDLRWIMDDPSVTTWFHFDSSKLFSIAVVTQEGPIHETLIQPILEGVRRPRGHLLPQSLVAHEGWLSAAQFSYWRISRIATDLIHQRQGAATQLLSDIETSAKAQNIDFLCSSFSAQSELIVFWQKNGFHTVRLGTSKDQASGSYSVMMVKGLTQKAHQQTIEWHENFHTNFYVTSLLNKQPLSSQLVMAMSKMTLGHNQGTDYPRITKDKQDILLFVEKHRPFSSIQPQLTRFIFHLMKMGKLSLSKTQHQLLCDVALGKESENTHSFSSKKHFLQSLKESLKEVINNETFTESHER